MAAVESMTAHRWRTLHLDTRHMLAYPSEHVVRWLAGLERGTALDIGCGSGRHLRLMLDFGFDAVGLDASVTLPTHRFHPGDMTALPFETDRFDAALAFGVFYYANMGDADRAVEEMHRVLKPGGQGFVSVRTGRDWRADHVDYYGAFRCEGEPEDGMLMDFISEDELVEIYGGLFSSVSYEMSEWTSHDRDRLNSDWLIAVTK